MYQILFGNSIYLKQNLRSVLHPSQRSDKISETFK